MQQRTIKAIIPNVNKNPVKFLSEINQQRLIEVSNDSDFLKEYDMWKTDN